MTEEYLGLKFRSFVYLGEFVVYTSINATADKVV